MLSADVQIKKYCLDISLKESPIFPVLGELQPAGHRADVPPAGGPRPRPLPGLLLGATRSDHPEDVGLFKGTPRKQPGVSLRRE